MKKHVLVWMLSFSALLLFVLLTAMSNLPGLPAKGAASDQQVNLALREIADRILKQNQDRFSPIPPILAEGGGAYLIRLGTDVDYASLRALVDATLKRHAIRADYRLSLIESQSREITLGFLAYERDENKEVACADREPTAACFDVRLTLLGQETQVPITQTAHSPQPIRWWLMGLAIGFPLLLLGWRKKPAPVVEKEAAADGWEVKTGMTAFHPVNQSLKINNAITQLTFREAKLLNYFFEHANLVLERDTILEAVWGDEGIIVGRSLDVFVSRLRKKLKADPGLNIVNVHGVGYRLELS